MLVGLERPQGKVEAFDGGVAMTTASTPSSVRMSPKPLSSSPPGNGRGAPCEHPGSGRRANDLGTRQLVEGARQSRPTLPETHEADPNRRSHDRILPDSATPSRVRKTSVAHVNAPLTRIRLPPGIAK